MRRRAVPCPDSSSSAAWRSAFASDAPRRSPPSSSSRWRSSSARRRVGAGVVDPLGGQPDGEALQDGADLQDLDRLVVRDLPHARTTMWLANDEPFLLQADECRSHRAARHLEVRADLRLDETGLRCDVTADDRFAQRVVARVRRRRHRVTHTAETLRRSSTILSYSRIGFADTQDSMNTVGVQQREQPSSLRRVAVLGLGEAGGRLAADLAAAGVEVRGFDPDPARDIRVDLPSPRRRFRCRRMRRRAQRQQRQGCARRCGSCPARVAGERHLRRREHGRAGAEARACGARRRGGRRLRRRRAARPHPRREGSSLRCSCREPPHGHSRISSRLWAYRSRSSRARLATQPR